MNSTLPLQTNWNLQEKLVVIVGGGGLIGFALSQRTLESGGKVICVDPNLDKLSLLEKFASDLGRLRSFFGFSSSLDGSAQAIDDFLSKMEAHFGQPITTLICAQYPRTKDWSDTFDKVKFSSFAANLETHLGSYFLWSQRVSIHMQKGKTPGSLILFSSIYGLVGPDFSIYEEGMTMPVAYSAIKGGVTNLVRYLATYFGRDSIRCNAIVPGGVQDQQDPRFVKNYSERVPLKRMANVNDITEPTLFLVSDSSRYITGVNLAVDGGWTAI